MTFTYSDAVYSLCPTAEYVIRGEAIEWLDVKQAQPTEAEIQAELARLIAEEPWKQLRLRRDRLLTETDYLALSDQTLTAEMAAYRQALRDLPANTVDPANPVWPTKPGGAS